ncbi:unnamed protein product, partial [marine sediment metagenome]
QQAPAQFAAPPSYNPAPPPLAATPAAAFARTAQISGSPALPIQTAAFPLAPLAAGALATGGRYVAANIGKIAAIAAGLGIGAEVVEAVLDVNKRMTRRRRRRLLTASDVKDITVMAALLGKGSQAFATWLATSQRSR